LFSPISSARKTSLKKACFHHWFETFSRSTPINDDFAATAIQFGHDACDITSARQDRYETTLIVIEKGNSACKNKPRK
jgi:hypothetical protein